MKTQQSLKEQLNLQIAINEEIKKSLKSTEQSLAWWQKKAQTNKKVLKTAFSFLVFVPLVLQFIFIGQMTDNWQANESAKVLYFVMIGVVTSVTAPIIIYCFLLLKIWDKK